MHRRPSGLIPRRSAGGLSFLSGVIPLEPKSGTLVETTIEGQTEQVMKNMSAVLEAAGLTFRHIVKTTVYLTDMNSFARFNEVYGKSFTPPFPARATIQVSRLPKDVLVEIEAVAFAPKA